MGDVSIRRRIGFLNNSCGILSMSAQILHKSAQFLPEWAAPVCSELDLVNRRLESVLTSDVDAAFDISVRLLMAGGKRIRPALVLLTAFARDPRADRDRVVNIAAAMELVHMASLVHDDVVDERLSRRGAPTATASWRNKISVLGGDFIFSKALSLLSADGDIEMVRALSATAVKMTESEVLQASCEGSLVLWEANYDRIIRDKTALLMGTCCECGAIAAGAGGAVRSAVREYGIAVGLAFQIADDVLDLVGDPSRTGKETGTDIANGKFTLPVLIATRESDPDARHRMISALSRELIGEEIEANARLVVESGAIEKALDIAVRHSEDARALLGVFSPSCFRDALRLLALHASTRES